MKKNLIIILLFIFTLKGAADNDCLPGIEAKAEELKKCERTKTIVLAIAADIINQLENCRFSMEDIKPFKTFYKKINKQITKLEKKKKEFPTYWYSKEFLTLISKLKTVEPPIKPDPQKRQDTGKKESKKPELEKKESPLPTGNESPEESSFMSEGFVSDRIAKSAENLSVITVGELKTKLDVVEKKLNYLSDMLHFYQIGFIVLIICAFLGLGLMALFIIYWRKDYKEFLHARAQAFRTGPRKDEWIEGEGVSSQRFLKDQ